MVTTEPTAALNAALAAAQGEFPPIPRDKTVQTGSYTFSYADLATILTLVRPVLAKNKLALTQLLEDNGHGPTIRTELRHADGGILGASFPLPGTPSSPQQLGSLLTYLRRYAIVSLLGIAAEEDDDGQQAAKTPMRKKNPDHGPRQKIVIGPDVDPLETDDEPGPDFGPIDDPALEEEPVFQAPAIRPSDPNKGSITDPQRRKIYALLTKLKRTGDPHFDDDNVQKQLAFYSVEHISELNREQARELIDILLKREQELGL